MARLRVNSSRSPPRLRRSSTSRSGTVVPALHAAPRRRLLAAATADARSEGQSSLKVSTLLMVLVVSGAGALNEVRAEDGHKAVQAFGGRTLRTPDLKQMVDQLLLGVTARQLRPAMRRPKAACSSVLLSFATA